MFRLAPITRVTAAFCLTAAVSLSGWQARFSSAAATSLSPAGIAAVLAKKQPVTIKVLNWGQGGPKYWDAAAKAFEKKYPWITVVNQEVPFNNYYAVEGKYIASGSGPDVMANNVGAELFERKTAYLPINNVLGPYVKDLIRYSDACEEFSTKNPCYGLPQSFQGNVLYFNADILKQAGLNPNSPPQTWQQMDAACKAIVKIGKACMAVGYGIEDSFWVFPEIARNFLTQAQMIQVYHGAIPWTDPKMTNILTYMAQMASNGWFQKDAATTQYIPGAGQAFIRGDAAFTPGIVSDVNNWKVFGDAIGYKKLGVMRWPAINPSAPLAYKFSGVEGFVHGVTTWSQHPNEAFLYVAWLASADNANLWLQLAGGQPINKTFNANLINYSPQFHQIQKIIQNATVHVGVLLSGREDDALARGFQQIILKQISVQDWVNMMAQAQQAAHGG